MHLKPVMFNGIKKESALFFLIPLFVLTSPLKMSAQEKIKGFVYSESNQPLAFCSLVYLKQNKGTYTDSLGQFLLPKHGQSKLNDSIYISYIGYEAQTLSLQNFKNGDTVFLKKQAYPLKEIQILPTEYEKVKFKNKGNSDLFHSGSGNSVMAYHIDHHHGGYLKKVTFFVRATGTQSRTALRISRRTPVYSNNTHLLDTNLIIKIKKGNRRITFDLSKYYIKIPEEGLLVGLEFINNPSYKRVNGENRFLMKLNDKIPEHQTYVGIPGKKWIPYKSNYQDGKAANLTIKYELAVEKP